MKNIWLMSGFGDGLQTRSFCYVDDLIDGIFKLLFSEYKFPMNLGNPNEISIKEFAEEIIEITNSKSKIIYTSLPQDDPKQRRPDISKAIEILSWSPKIDRKYGIEKTLNYFKSLPKGEKNKLHKTFNKIHD